MSYCVLFLEMPELLSRSSKQNTRKLLIKQIFVMKNILPNTVILRVVLGFTLRGLMSCSPAQGGRTETHQVLGIPESWHAHEECTSCIYAAQCCGLFLSPWSPISMQPVHKLGWFPKCFHLGQRARERHHWVVSNTQRTSALRHFSSLQFSAKTTCNLLQD